MVRGPVLGLPRQEDGSDRGWGWGGGGSTFGTEPSDLLMDGVSAEKE